MKVALVVLAVFLSACGGGGGSASALSLGDWVKVLAGGKTQCARGVPTRTGFGKAIQRGCSSSSRAAAAASTSGPAPREARGSTTAATPETILATTAASSIS